MSFARIILPINDQDDVSPLASLAFKLAETYDAEVQGFFPQRSFLEEFWFPGEGASAMQIQQLYEDAQKRTKEAALRARQKFEKITEVRTDIRTSFLNVEGRVEEETSRVAMASDLTVIGNRNQFDTSFWHDVCDGVLVYAGRPVIIAPPDQSEGTIAENLLIAWKEGPEATRAIAAAKPFFANAKHIVLTAVDADEVTEKSINMIKEYVDLHGVRSEVELIKTNNRGVGKALVDQALDREGTLMIMGGYSHSRWRERAFGGVTEYVLRETKVPVLMVH